MAIDDLRGIGNPQTSFATKDQELEYLRQEVQYQKEEAEYYKQALSGGDPWKNNPVQTADERFADRMLCQRMPDDQHPHGQKLWITRSDILELLAIIPSLSRKQYNRFVRDWEDIETLSQGGGNAQIVQSRQERLLFEINLSRSVGDAPVSGMTERILLSTKRQEISQNINTQSAQKRAAGFFSDIFGWGGGQ